MGHSVDRLRALLAAGSSLSDEQVALAAKKVWVPPHLRFDAGAKKIIHVEGYWRTVMAGSSGHLPKDVKAKAKTHKTGPKISVAKADGAISGANYVLQSNLPNAGNASDVAAWQALTSQERLDTPDWATIREEAGETIAFLTAAKANPDDGWVKGDTVRIGRARGRLEDALEMATIAEGLRTGEMSPTEAVTRLDALEERYGPEKILKTQTKDMPVAWGLVWRDLRVAAEDMRIDLAEANGEYDAVVVWAGATKGQRLQWAKTRGFDAAPMLDPVLLDEWHDIEVGHAYLKDKWGWAEGTTPAARKDAIEALAIADAETSATLAQVDADVDSVLDDLVLNPTPEGMHEQYAFYHVNSGAPASVIRWNAVKGQYGVHYIHHGPDGATVDEIPALLWSLEETKGFLKFAEEPNSPTAAHPLPVTGPVTIPDQIPPHKMALQYVEAGSDMQATWNPETGKYVVTGEGWSGTEYSAAMIQSIAAKGGLAPTPTPDDVPTPTPDDAPPNGYPTALKVPGSATVWTWDPEKFKYVSSQTGMGFHPNTVPAKMENGWVAYPQPADVGYGELATEYVAHKTGSVYTWLPDIQQWENPASGNYFFANEIQQMVEAGTLDVAPVEGGDATPSYKGPHGTKVPADGFKHTPPTDMAVQYVWAPSSGTSPYPPEVYTWVGTDDVEYVEESSGQPVSVDTLKDMLAGPHAHTLTAVPPAGPIGIPEGDVTGDKPPGGLHPLYTVALPNSGVTLLNVWSPKYGEYAQFEQAPGSDTWTLTEVSKSPGQMKNALLETPGWFTPVSESEVPTSVLAAVEGTDALPPHGLAPVYKASQTGYVWTWTPSLKKYVGQTGGKATPTDMAGWVDKNTVEVVDGPESSSVKGVVNPHGLPDQMVAPHGAVYEYSPDLDGWKKQGTEAVVGWPDMAMLVSKGTTLPYAVESTKTGEVWEYDGAGGWIADGDDTPLDFDEVQLLMKQGTLKAAIPKTAAAPDDSPQPTPVPAGGPPGGMPWLFEDVTNAKEQWFAWSPVLGKYVSSTGLAVTADSIDTEAGTGAESLKPGTVPPPGMAPQYVSASYGDQTTVFTWDGAGSYIDGLDGEEWNPSEVAKAAKMGQAIPTVVALNADSGTPFPFIYNQQTGYFESPGKMTPSVSEVKDMLADGTAVSGWDPAPSASPAPAAIATAWAVAPEDMAPQYVTVGGTAPLVLQWDPQTGDYADPVADINMSVKDVGSLSQSSSKGKVPAAVPTVVAVADDLTSLFVWDSAAQVFVGPGGAEATSVDVAAQIAAGGLVPTGQVAVPEVPTPKFGDLTDLPEGLPPLLYNPEYEPTQYDVWVLEYHPPEPPSEHGTYAHPFGKNHTYFPADTFDLDNSPLVPLPPVVSSPTGKVFAWNNEEQAYHALDGDVVSINEVVPGLSEGGEWHALDAPATTTGAPEGDGSAPVESSLPTTPSVQVPGGDDPAVLEALAALEPPPGPVPGQPGPPVKPWQAGVIHTDYTVTFNNGQVWYLSYDAEQNRLVRRIDDPDAPPSGTYMVGTGTGAGSLRKVLDGWNVASVEVGGDVLHHPDLADIPDQKDTKAINAWLKTRGGNYTGKMTASQKATWVELWLAGHHTGWFELERRAALKGKKPIVHKNQIDDPNSPYSLKGKKALAAMQEVMAAHPAGQKVLASPDPSKFVVSSLTYEERFSLLHALGMHHNLRTTWNEPLLPSAEVATYEGVQAVNRRLQVVLRFTNFDQMPPRPATAALKQDEGLALVDLPGDHGKAYLVGSAAAWKNKVTDAVVIANADGSTVTYTAAGKVLPNPPGSEGAVLTLQQVADSDGMFKAIVAKGSPARPDGIPDPVWNLALLSEGDPDGTMLKSVYPALAYKQFTASQWGAMSKVIGPLFGGAYLTDLPEGQRRVALWAVIDTNPALASALGMSDVTEAAPDAPNTLLPALQALAPRHLTTPPQLRRRGRFATNVGMVSLELRPGDVTLRHKGSNEWLVVRGAAWPVPGERLAIRGDGTVVPDPGVSISEYAAKDPTEVLSAPAPKTAAQVAKATGMKTGAWNTLQTVEALSPEQAKKALLNHVDDIDEYLIAHFDGTFQHEASAAFKAHAPTSVKYLYARSSPDTKKALNWMADNGHWGGGETSLPEGLSWSSPWLANAAKGLTSPEQIDTWSVAHQNKAVTDLTNAGLYNDLGKTQPEALSAALDTLLGSMVPGSPKMPGVATPDEPSKPAGPAPGVELSLTPDTSIKLGGMHSKKVWKDQFDRLWMSKGFPSDPNSKARVDAEHWAMEMGRLHGFRNPESRVMTVSGNYSYVQHLAPKQGDMSAISKPWEQLDESQLVDALREHVNDWAVSNHDTHHENLLRHPDGFVFGIDKGQAFKFLGQSQETLYSVEGGKVRGWHPPGNGAPVWYDKAYAAVADGSLDKDKLRRVTKSVLQRAKAVSTQKDTQHREMLEAAFANRTNFPNGLTREQFVDLAMARKEAVFDDFVAMWKDVWASGGYEWDVDTANLGVGVIHHPKTGQAVYSGISAEYIADVQHSKSLGVPTFFAGTDLEDSHMLLWEEVEPDGDRMLVGEGKLRAEADAAVTSFLKSEGYTTGDAGTSAPSAPADPLPGNSGWHATIVAAAKTVNHHAPDADPPGDGEYNTTTLGALATTKQQLVSIKNALEPLQADNKIATAYVDTPAGPIKIESLHQQQGYIDMSTTYLEIINQIETAKASGTKTPSKKYEAFIYVPQKPKVVVEEWTKQVEGGVLSSVKHDDGSWAITHPDGSIEEVDAHAPSPDDGWSKVTKTEAAGKELKIVKNSAYRPAGQFDVTTAELKQTGGKVTHGNAGNRYDITYGDVEIEYRPWKGEGVPKAQQGTLRFNVKNWSGDEQQLQDLFDVMAKMGVNLDPATEVDLELFYWRHLNGVLNNRKLTTSHEAGRKHIAEWYATHPNPSPEEEIAALREGFSLAFSKKAVAEADYLPKVQAGGFGRQGGKPYWTRPDARSVREWIDKKGSDVWLRHHLKNEDHVPLMAGSGGLLSTEERMRALGQFIAGSSSTSDQGHGSSGFLFFKPGSSSPTNSSIMFSPLLYNRTSNYSFGGDNYGEIDNRKNAALSLDGVSKSGQYEMLTKNFVSLLEFMEVITVSSQSKRAEILKVFEAAGITEIRGIPVEERVVTNTSDAAKVLKKAREGYLKNPEWGDVK